MFHAHVSYSEPSARTGGLTATLAALGLELGTLVTEGDMAKPTGQRHPFVGHYSKIYSLIWDDPDFRNLDHDCQLIAIHFLTTRQANRIGIFKLSLAQVAEDLGYPIERVSAATNTICDTLYWSFDAASRVIFIPSWWRWNWAPNAKAMEGYLNDLAQVPESALKQAFMENDKHLEADILTAFRKGIERVSKGYRPGIASCTSASACTDASSSDTNETASKPTIKISTKAVEAIYLAYPKHVGKTAALKAITTAIKRLAELDPPKDTEWIMERVQTYATARAGQDKQFTPNPATWFNEGRYDDDQTEWEPPTDPAHELWETDSDDPRLAREPV